MKILADSSLPGLEEAFPKPFALTQYTHQDELPTLLANQDVLLCRATLKVNQHLLNNHSLKFVATASSGTDHLDHSYLKKQQIKIIDAKGCNAVSVADYVAASLAFLDQHHLITGNKAGIIGMGQVGTKVFNRLDALKFQVKTYDPPKAELDKQFQSCELNRLFDCDILCIHAELHDTTPHPSRNLINQDFLNKLKPGCIIINASRGGIINEEELIHAHQSLIYCTDVYLNEPDINKHIIEKATLCTPHIAGHSLEAKYNAVALVSKQLHQMMSLPIPEFTKPKFLMDAELIKSKSWQDLVLSIYNPAIETRYLKEAENLQSAFLTLRKNHQFRHDFSIYSNLLNNESAHINNKILGQE
jgi:erythronate-4-phosphate dehydrogenase